MYPLLYSVLSGLTARDQWALFINSGQQEVYEKLIEENKTFEEAYERLKKASSDETLMAMYRNREKAIRDWNVSINSARKLKSFDFFCLR